MNTSIKQTLSSMILSASGWRGVFAISGNEEDSTLSISENHSIISVYMAKAYADFIKAEYGKDDLTIAVGIDARPTGKEISDIFVKVLSAEGLTVQYLGITAAPEIMAYSHLIDGFVYISASHNPIGHNGVKFGKNDGGVIPGEKAKILAENFKSFFEADEETIKQTAKKLIEKAEPNKIKEIYNSSNDYKKLALKNYFDFTTEVISGKKENKTESEIFKQIALNTQKTPLAIVCDMNGSARTLSIDSEYFADSNIGFFAFNNKPGNIVHAIIPEPENLIHCANEMADLQNGKSKNFDGMHTEAILGYMPDCDGDRGNIVFWNTKTKTAEVLKAQEVFALSVLSELAYLAYCGQTGENSKIAVAVNDPTSMRIEEIASAFGSIVARAEVGEANVVNRARELRSEGYIVRILGEGSNGGNITHPAAVRDPLNSIFALIKLLTLKDVKDSTGKITKFGLFHTWCNLSNQENLYKEDFSLIDVIESLPKFTTTGVSEQRALLKIKTMDHAKLKANYQKVFETEYTQKKEHLESKFGITKYIAIANNGTKETKNITDFSVSNRGGLKILFQNNKDENIAFMWMRGSGTEPVFRIMCDVKGTCPELESELLKWHTSMIQKADN